MKSKSSGQQRRIGAVLQYMQMAFSIAIQLVYTPFMLRMLGKAEYGIYNIASSTIAYLSLLSLGFGASYLRWYSAYKKDEDEERISRLNGLYLLVFVIIGLVALGLGFFLAANVGWFYNDTYTAGDIEIAKTLMFLLTINLAISFPASVFTSYITSQERFIFQKIVNMGKTILSPAASILLLCLGFGSIGMVITTTCVSVLVDIINVYFCLAKLKMKICFHNLEWTLLKEIFTFSIFIAMNQIIDQINWQTDKIILGKVVNGTAVAVYAVGASLNTMFTHFSTAVSHVFVPKVNRIVSLQREDMDAELTELFIKVGRVQWFVLSLILSGFVIFGRYFVERWAGQDYGNAYYVALLLMAPAIIPLIQNLGIEIQRAKYLHKFRSVVYLMMALLNVIVSIFLAKKWGELGAASGTTFALLLSNGLIMNIYYHRKCGIDIAAFWKSIGSTLKAYVIPALCGVVLLAFCRYRSLLVFSVLVLAYLCVFCLSLYFWGLNKSEKQMVKAVVAKLRRKN